MRKTAVEGHPGKYQVEPWVVSASLDGTLRKWRLMGETDLSQAWTRKLTADVDLLKPTPKSAAPQPKVEAPPPPKPEKKTDNPWSLSEEEERELAELMDDDD